MAELEDKVVRLETFLKDVDLFTIVAERESLSSRSSLRAATGIDNGSSTHE